jgi:hypothetical protein
MAKPMGKKMGKSKIVAKPKSKSKPVSKDSRVNAKKMRLLSTVRKEVVSGDQEDEVELSEAVSRKKLDPIAAPGIDLETRMKKRWKGEETERELKEGDNEAGEGMGIEKEESAGEEPNQEIEKVIKEDADEDEGGDDEDKDEE